MRALTYPRPLVAAITLACCTTVNAQESSESTRAGLEEIVVTAMKRETSLLDTPISISALSEDLLKDMGAANIADYIHSVPALQMVDNGPGQQRLALRGIQGTGEAQVGLYYDETPVTGSPGTTSDAGSSMPDLDLFDVERLEVLRGPQGTLYGSGSMGGTVRVIFNKPDPTLYEGAIDMSYSSTKQGGNGYKTAGMVNVPLVEDVLAARAVLYKKDQEGYIDNIRTNQEDINDYSAWGGRFMLGYYPTDNLTIQASAHLQRADTADSAYWLPEAGTYKNNRYTVAPFEDDTNIYNLTLDWDLGFANLTATGSHYSRDTLRTWDNTQVVLNTLDSASRCEAYIGNACDSEDFSTYNDFVMGQTPMIIYQPMTVENDTFEVRLTSLSDGPIAWTTGIYSEDRESTVDSQRVVTTANGYLTSPMDIRYSRTVWDALEQQAMFGEVSYDLSDKTTLTVGARYYDFERTVAGQVDIGTVLNGTTPVPYNSVTSSEDGFIYKFHLAYDLTDDILLYAQAAEGFRPGGANQIIGLPDFLTAYEADSLWSYEIGMKGSWLDGLLLANVAIYRIDWDNMQVNGSTADGLFWFISNAGKAQSEGIEFEIATSPVEGLELRWTGNYVDARLTEDQVNDNVSAEGQDGDRIPNIPQFSTSLSARYSWPLSDAMNGMVFLDTSYTGNSYSDFNVNAYYYEETPSYTNTNLRAGIEAPDSEWGVYLYVNNLFDEVSATRVSTSSQYGTQSTFSIAPRTFGLNLKRNF